ncbi:MAG: glycosyltransferase family 2 protein [Stagnimonas sp.]|nr:glycosyltransferase family 2 protein [Stagnimonas sp.]
MNAVLSVFDWLLIVAAMPLLLSALYLLLLTVLSARLPTLPAATKPWRFAVVVPAHNEAQVIERTVNSLKALHWPAEQFQVQVIADNCTDDTAALAAAAGASVRVRHDAVERGKGYALRHAYEQVLTEGWADAVVVVDADSEAAPELLAVFAAQLESGEGALQAHYGVLNPDASWRTRLMHIAYELFIRVRSRGRERLGVSCGLRGNGMCFAVAVLRKAPHRSFSVMEDLEYGIQLADVGVRVAYTDAAAVYGEMVTDTAASGTQRQRWEGGRSQMRRQHALRLVGQGLRGNKLALDLALDLLVLPLAQLGALTAVAFAAALVLALLGGSAVPLVLTTTALVALVIYVFRGWQLSGTGLQGLRDLLRAPLYLIWKLALLFKKGSKPTEWVRTERNK